jgi:predicted alpha/beta superfamily hydrolase
MQARGFEWDHEIRVALPASYSTTTRTYPVLWVTDGGFLFEYALQSVATVRYSLPEMIIVSVGAPPEAQADQASRRLYDFTPSAESVGFEGFGSEFARQETEKRDRQLGAQGEKSVASRIGGAPRFLEFLVDVVRPALALDYRMSDSHTLFGESAGGIFCGYALFTRPEAFEKYICASPGFSFGNFELFRIEERYARTHRDLPAEVFFSAGEAEILQGGMLSASGIVSSTARMAEILKMRNYPSLKLHVRIFQGEDHGSVIPMNFSWGLRTLWQDEARSAK